MTRRLVTALEAAELVGVQPSTVAGWVHRGLLAAVTVDGRRHLYADDEVYAAERKARKVLVHQRSRNACAATREGQ